MGESSASYIRLVHHLIEECILFNMNREECMEALAKHANILPVITSTVWKELEKENKEFFEAYKRRSRGESWNNKKRLSDDGNEAQAQARRKIHQALSDSSSSSSSSSSSGTDDRLDS